MCLPSLLLPFLTVTVIITVIFSPLPCDSSSPCSDVFLVT